MTIRKRVMTALMMIAIAVFALTNCGDAEGRSGHFDPGSGSPRPQQEPKQGPEQQARDREPVSTPDPRMEGDRLYGIWPQVWSQHAPEVASWEYKVNCDSSPSHTDPCFLSDLTSVNVEAPDGSVTELEFDFNTNQYSGEVTRRWVKYGPSDGSLPSKGDFIFRYWRGDELEYEQAVRYASDPISYPTDLVWRRDGDDLVVDWSPPPEADKSMWYKAIIWQVDDTPPVLVSQLFDWDAASGVLEDIPLIEGGSYSLNVAIFFSDGYAYSERVIFDWPGEGQAK
jgi:hypothetical protein